MPSRAEEIRSAGYGNPMLLCPAKRAKTEQAWLSLTIAVTDREMHDDTKHTDRRGTPAVPTTECSPG